LTNPYLEPVAPVWTRAAGITLLVAATSVTAVLGHALFDVAIHPASRLALTSSSVVFALILTALGGICWQAGFRLAFRRRGQASLFSRPAWFAIGAALVVMAALMAAVIVSARTLTLVDYQVVLSLGAFGIWCVVLSWRVRR
jgi:hypothetical protein